MLNSPFYGEARHGVGSKELGEMKEKKKVGIEEPEGRPQPTRSFSGAGDEVGCLLIGYRSAIPALNSCFLISNP